MGVTEAQAAAAAAQEASGARLEAKPLAPPEERHVELADVRHEAEASLTALPAAAARAEALTPQAAQPAAPSAPGLLVLTLVAPKPAASAWTAPKTAASQVSQLMAPKPAALLLSQGPDGVQRRALEPERPAVGERARWAAATLSPALLSATAPTLLPT
jgi:hypothetical protein